MYYEMLYECVKDIDSFVTSFVGTLFLGERYYEKSFNEINRSEKVSKRKSTYNITPSFLESLVIPHKDNKKI